MGKPPFAQRRLFCVPLIVLAGALWPGGAAFGVPRLQLYSPDGQYMPENDDNPLVSESWYVLGNDFDLWVLGHSTKAPISDVRISVAILPDEWASGGTVTIGWADAATPDWYDIDYPDPPTIETEGYDYIPLPYDIPDGAGTLTLTFDGDLYDADAEPPTGHYLHGTPYLGDPAEGSVLPSHGTYPTYFTELNLGFLNTTSTWADLPENQVWDAIGDGDDGVHYWETDDKKPGLIYKLHVEVSGFTFVSFDAHDGLQLDDPGYKTVFAPFSHDTVLQTPEPASFAFFGLVVAAGAARRVRARRRGTRNP